MANWMKLNPAGRVNITDQDAFNQATDVAKYANGRLVPNDRTRVHRDWKYEDIEWNGEQPDTYSLFTRFEGVFPLDIDNAPDGEPPLQLGYLGVLIRLDEGGPSDQTVFNVAIPNGDGTWKLDGEGRELNLRWWTDEGQVNKLSGPNSWDYTKAGAWVLVGSVGDPFAVIPDDAGTGIAKHHLLARMRQPTGEIQIEDELYVGYETEGVKFWRKNVVDYTGMNGNQSRYAMSADPFTQSPAIVHISGWNILGFYYTELYTIDGTVYESPPKRIGFAAGPARDFWFYHKWTTIWASYQVVSQNAIWTDSDTFAGWVTPFNSVWPSPDDVNIPWNVDDEGQNVYRWNWAFFQATGNNGPINANTGIKYRLYYQQFGVTRNAGLSYDMSLDLTTDPLRYFWCKPGSFFGEWDGSGNYTPVDFAVATGLQDYSIGGYDPTDAAVELAKQWVDEKAPLLGQSFKEINPRSTDWIDWIDPLYDPSLYDGVETYTTEKVEFGDGKGVIRYDQAVSPSRYIIVEQFRGHTLSVPLDNPSVIEFGPPDVPYYRPAPFKLFIQTDGNDEILAIKAYQNAALIFTRSHVLKLNYLPVDGVFQDSEVIEVMCKGRVLTERKAIATVSFNNSHYIAWMSRDGLNISDGNIVYNACPDFSLEALNFTLTTDADDRMTLINNVDDYRLELWLHGENAERWDFYYHDSHLIQQRFLKLRGPTQFSFGCRGAAYIPDQPGQSRRTGRTLVIKYDGDFAIQTDNYTDDTLKWWGDRIWGADPLDLVRFDGMMLEIPGTAGHDYYTYNYASSTEASAARKERNQMDLFAGSKLCKAALEDSSGEWVQPGFEIEHSVIGDTWVGAVWLKILGKDRAN